MGRNLIRFGGLDPTMRIGRRGDWFPWTDPQRGLAFYPQPSFHAPLSDAGAGALDLSLAAGVGPATFTRASPAWTFDAGGALVQVGANVARSYYDPAALDYRGYVAETASSNQVRNNTMVGAVAGAPGTMPSQWFANLGAEITREVAGVGVENGIEYIDLRFFGTVTAARQISIGYQASVLAAAVPAEVWNHSVFLKLIAGSFANVPTTQVLVSAADAGGAFLAHAGTDNVPPGSTGALRANRKFASGPMPALTAFANCFIFYQTAAAGAVDFTLRLGLPQLEKAGWASTPIKTLNVLAVTRAADVLTFPIAGNMDATQGTAAAEIYSLTNIAAVGNQAFLAMNSGTYLLLVSNAQQLTTISQYDGSGTAFKSGLSSLGTGVRKRAANWGAGTMAVAGDGAAPVSAAFDGSHGAAGICVGSQVVSEQMNGTIKNLRIWNVKRADIQALTA